MDTATERYERDPAFHHFVDLIETLLNKAQYTPSELREAVMLAAIHYEAKHIQPMYKAMPDGGVIVYDRNFKG